MLKKGSNKYLKGLMFCFILFSVFIVLFGSSFASNISINNSNSEYLASGDNDSLPSNWNKQEIDQIDKNTTDFTFAFYGDSRNSTGVYESMLQDINTKNVLFSIHCGDMGNIGTLEEFQKFFSQISVCNAPVLVVMGNHETDDVKYGNGSYQNYTNVFGTPYYSFATKNSYFIILNDANVLTGLDNGQMNWLKNELINSLDYKNRLVFMHTPLYSPGSDEYSKNHVIKNETNVIELNNLFNTYNVSMIFTSHIHRYYEGIWNNIPFILSGGAGGPLAGTDPSTCFYHYFLVHVTNQGIKYELVRFNNTNSSIIDPDLVSNKGQEVLKPVINTIGMQNTGLPVLGLIFAVLAIFGGLFISKWK